ncbi:MAG: chromate transporter [Lachnospiraceae bacterium]|nr:chromate transporter [Lachnospiraceae bacterium]
MSTDILLYLQIFWEFFKIGLFAVGGGPATLPYLMELTKKYDWFTMEDLTNMIAVSESTPGPLGVNMATYAGFTTLGTFGGIVSTLGLVLPSLIVIIIIAAFFSKMNKNPKVQAAFKTIRPAVTGVIAAAVLGICRVSLFSEANGGLIILWKSMILASVVLGLIQIKKLKNIHPFLWFVAGASVGIIFRF